MGGVTAHNCAACVASELGGRGFDSHVGPPGWQHVAEAALTRSNVEHGMQALVSDPVSDFLVSIPGHEPGRIMAGPPLGVRVVVGWKRGHLVIMSPTAGDYPA
jgi:hypothetical protein